MIIDKYTRLIFVGILCCLIVIAIKQNPNSNVPVSPSSPPSNVIVNGLNIIQIGPNVIGIKDSGRRTGIPDQILIFEYEPISKAFKYISTLNYSEYIDHPEKYGVPRREVEK